MHVDNNKSRWRDAAGSWRRTYANGRVQDGGAVSHRGVFDDMAGKVNSVDLLCNG